MPVHFIYNSRNESDTERFGAALASVLPPDAVVALLGTLGTGKTRLVRAVATAVGVEPKQVLSPTFVLVHEYQPRQPELSVARTAFNPLPTTIYHLDAYRIRDEDEFWQLGPDEFYESAGWTFIEWADRVSGCLPREYLQIELEVTAPDGRRILVTSVGAQFESTVERLAAALQRQPDA